MAMKESDANGGGHIPRRRLQPADDLIGRGIDQEPAVAADLAA